MIRSKLFRQAGVTLTELLVVLVIVSILATIAVPVYINKAENARISVAQVECREIAEAEEACAIQHGFYVPLQVLDDLPMNASSNTNGDSIDRETSVYAIDQAQSYLNLNTNQVQISSSALDPRVARMVNKWQGPFLNPQRVYTGPDDTGTFDPNSAYLREDYPLDPWGNAYRFYAPDTFGLIGSAASQSDMSVANFSDGQVTTTDSRQYDRYAIVSYGPDGVSQTDSSSAGSPLNLRNDDIVYFFGKVNPLSNNTATTTTATVTPTP